MRIAERKPPLVLLNEILGGITDMVRTATVADAEQLNALNNEFNGEGETTLENIRDCLSCNPQEVSNTSLPFSLKESPQIWYDHNNFKVVEYR